MVVDCSPVDVEGRFGVDWYKPVEVKPLLGGLDVRILVVDSSLGTDAAVQGEADTVQPGVWF